MIEKVALTALLALFGTLNAFGNNVSVRYSRGEVLVEGDDDANSIEIRSVGLYFHEFRGLNGTRINGSSSPLILPIMDDLNILMERGDDFVRIRNLRLTETSEANLAIKLGEGDDHLDIDKAFMTGYLSVLCNSSMEDNDYIKMYDTTADFANIETRDRSEVVLLYNEFGLFLDTGRSGADDVTLIGNKLGHLIEIDLSDGNDDIQFYGNHVHPVYWNGIRLHGGHDEADVWMEWYHFQFLSPWPVRFFAGTGFDVITLKGSGNVEPYDFDVVFD